MKPCDAVRKNLNELAAMFPAEVPVWAREHAASCRRCSRRLAAARLVRAAIQSSAAETEPPAGFAARVAEAVFRRPVPRRTEAELWRPAWGLVPAFGAVVLALFIVFQGNPAPEPTGLFSIESLSSGERLVLAGSSVPDADTVLAALFEGGGK